MLTDVPLRTGLTPAVVAGRGVQIVIGWGSLLSLVALGGDHARRRVRRRRREDAGPRRDRRLEDA